MQELFIELIQVSIGCREHFSSAPSNEEWHALFEMVQKQALTGLCKVSLDKLPECQWPPYDVVLKWYAASRQIEIRNYEVNLAVSKVTLWFNRNGFVSCILKGQGNALLYPKSGMRTAGDIDIWVEGGCRRVIKFARRCGISGKACYHHIDWRPYNDISMEVHYRPTFMLNPFYNYRLQKWFEKYADLQFNNVVSLPQGEGQIAVPTFRFNVIYQLSHIANHFFQEGIGLRQFADYYFLLLRNKDAVDVRFKEDLEDELKYLGLHDFARAVMWVLGRVFLMDRVYMIVPPDEKRGSFLLDEIIEGGNFGQYDNRIFCGVQVNSVRHNIARIYRDVRLLRFFPSECLCEPVFRFWHFLWRYMNNHIHISFY